MRTYPQVLSERETLDLVIDQRLSLSRFGDGELRLACGPPAKQCKTQGHNEHMQIELCRMLLGGTKSLVCLPRIRPGIPLYDKLWSKFLHKKWTSLIVEARYGSSFISRPESAPEINVPDYWERVTQLWAGRAVTLVIGDMPRGEKPSLIPSDLREAKSVDVIHGPYRDAYSMISNLDDAIGDYRDLVILCLGTAATCLAERLAQRGTQAVDLGSIGRWIRRWRKEHPHD